MPADRHGQNMEAMLPAQPPLLARIVSTLSDPCADVSSMARGMAATPELSHAFVRLANTFGRRGRVSNAADAILELGPRASKQLVSCLAAKKHLSGISSHGLGLDEFWLSSLRRAFACHTIASSLGIGNDLSMFSVGFHQDIGVLLRAQHDRAAAEAMTELMDAPAQRRLRAERRRGTPHDELGLAFCGSWGLSAEIAVPVRYHHEPRQAPSAFADAAMIASAAESIADLATTSDASPVLGLAEQALSNLNIHGLLPKLFDRVADYVDDTAEAFGIDAVPEPRFSEICERSQARMNAARRPTLANELAHIRHENEALREQLARVSEELATVRRSYPPSGVMGIGVDSTRGRRQVP